MSRLYWLSFADPDRPPGTQFLGVCIVEVTEAEASARKPRLPPTAQPGAEWIAAAADKAWALGCNPGGEVQSVEIEATDLPLHRLLTRDELHLYGATASRRH